MGAGFHGGFGRTKGGRTIYEGTSKSSALSSVSSLPKEIQSSAKSFFKGGSNHYNSFSGIYDHPDRSLERYAQYAFLLTPDFSTYADMDL